MNNDLYREQIEEGRRREHMDDEITTDLKRGFHSSHEGTTGICRTCDAIEEEARLAEQGIIWPTEPEWADIWENNGCGAFTTLYGGVNCLLVKGHAGPHKIGDLWEGDIYEWTDEAPTEPAGSEKFHQLLREIGDLHDRKQKDYGTKGDPFANVRASAEFGVAPWVGALIRENDKTTRLKSYIANGSLANEGVRDSLMDKAVYSLIALILFDEEQDASRG